MALLCHFLYPKPNCESSIILTLVAMVSASQFNPGNSKKLSENVYDLGNLGINLYQCSRSLFFVSFINRSNHCY